MENNTNISESVDLAKHLQQNQYLTDRDKPINPTFNAVIAFVAEVFFFIYALCDDARFYIRQLVYGSQRLFKYNRGTPQEVREDVASLAKVPRHIALVLKGANDPETALSKLLTEATMGVMWCVGCGSEQLTLYERNGRLKSVKLESVAEVLTTGLARYFNDEEMPLLSVRSGRSRVTAGSVTNRTGERPVLEITLVSEDDGRPLMVDLARKYSHELAQGKLALENITVGKVDHDVQELVGGEPDLLVSFDSNLDVAGFPPWLLRVTELFSLPDNEGVFHYMVFYLALRKFANVKVNLGA